MSVLGNNLLAQYYAQNQFKYIDNPELWLEADSWGTSVWTNKGNGGYDLTCIASNTGSKDGDAIVTDNKNIAYGIMQNVFGAASFTLEAVLYADSSLLSTSNGGWFATSRTSSAAQPNSVQIAFGNAGSFFIEGWDSHGNRISENVPRLDIVTSSIAYYSAGYDAINNVLFKQFNNQVISWTFNDYACLIDKFMIGNSGKFSNNLTSAGNLPFLGKIYSIRVYQRALSEAERANNMRRDKARFNF